MTDISNPAIDSEAGVDSADGQYIKEVFGEACGPWGARILYYRNVHPKHAIRITIRHHWIYNGEVVEDPPYDVVLQPNPYGGENPNDKDARMGCPIPGPTTQRFNWDVKNPRWA